MDIIIFSSCVFGSIVASIISGNPPSFGGLVFGVYFTYAVISISDSFRE